jgi:prefoldin subunit 5
MTNQALAFSADPNLAMQEMMSVIDALRSVYVRENEVLAASDARAFVEIQKEKFEAAQKYQAGVEDLMKRKESMKSASPVLKNRLVEMEKEFSQISEKNIEALKRMQRCVERVGQTIMNAAKDAARKRRAVAYGESGALRGDAKTVSMGVSETA